MAKYILETRGLTKRFGRGARAQAAVDRVSLHVGEGMVYGLLGLPEGRAGEMRQARGMGEAARLLT